MGAGNEAAASWNDVFWWITARTTSLESRALLWERQTAHSVVTESLNFKHSAARAFAQQHIYTNVYLFVFFLLFFFFFSSDRLVQARPPTLTMLCLYFALIKTSGFAEMKFAVMGVSCCCHIPILLNAKWGRVYWIMIRHQQLRCYNLYIPSCLDMEAIFHLITTDLFNFKQSCPYWGIGDEMPSCAFGPGNSSFSYFLLTSHRGLRVMASVNILWQIVLL